jgi:hypothetical protein
MADELVLRVGELGGRVIAMESRMDRHEAYMGEKLRSVETRLGSMDEKLDSITVALASSKAEATGRGTLIRWVLTGVGAIGTLLGYHFSFGAH